MYDASVPMLAGVPVTLELVRELAERVGEPTATTLRGALEREPAVIASPSFSGSRFSGRSRIARTGLAELRGVLLQDHEWRKQQGLV
jgi:hypothetical protein